MKKKIICLTAAFVLALNSVSVFAGETETAESTVGLYEMYSSSLSRESDNPYLSLDEAIERTLRNNSTVKNTRSSIDLLDKTVSNTAEIYVSSIVQNNASLLAFENSKVTLKNAEISMDILKDTLAYSVKQLYVGIILSELSLELTRQNLDITAKELNNARIKKDRGLISLNAYNAQELDYKNAVLDYEKQKSTLNESYNNLNILMGVDVTNRYSFSLPIEYEKLELSVPYENYVANALSTNPTIKTLENNLKSKENNVKFYLSDPNSFLTESYDTVNNSLQSATLELRDARDTAETTIRTLYTEILQSENSLEAAASQYELTKKRVGITETNYERGLVSEITLEKAKLGLAASELSILSSYYTHMLNVEKFNTPSLI